MVWLALSLLSAFSLASADAATKRWLSGYSGAELVLVRFVFVGLILMPWVLTSPWPELPPAFWAWIAGLLPLEIGAMWLYMVAIRDSPLYLTLPYLAFTPVFTVVTGNLLLGETVSYLGLLGILLIVVGSYLLNIERAVGGHGWAWLAPLAGLVRERGSRLMLGVAALYSLTSVGGKGAMQYTSPTFFGPFYFSLVALTTVATFAILQRGAFTRLARRPRIHLLVGALMAAMVMTHFLAIDRVEVAYMIAVKRTSLLFGMVYGALLFGEERLRQHLGAGALMVIGVFLLML